MHASSHIAIKEWAEQASGKNLRWETVGLPFLAVGLRLSGVTCVEDNSHH